MSESKLQKELLNKVKRNRKPETSATIKALMAMDGAAGEPEKENKSTNKSTKQSTNKSTYIEEKKQKKVGVRIDTDMCKYIEKKFGTRGYGKAIDLALRLLKKTEDELGEEHIKKLMKEFE